MSDIFSYLPLAGRFLIGFYFLFFGFWNSYYWRPTVAAMHDRKIPCAGFVLIIGIVLESLTGLMIIFAFHPRIAAFLLIPFVLVATVIFHHFWTMEGEVRRLNTVIFIGNITVTLGGLVLLLNMISPAENLAAFLS